MWSVAWLVPLGLVVGAYGTLIGAGGGFVLVPILALLYPTESPELLASISFVLTVMALAGTLVHIATGVFAHGVRRTLALGIGVLLGAQLGARLSGRIRGGWILRGLAIALAFIGARVLLQALGPP